jgi:hypothetical protein
MCAQKRIKQKKRLRKRIKQKKTLAKTHKTEEKLSQVNAELINLVCSSSTRHYTCK